MTPSLVRLSVDPERGIVELHPEGGSSFEAWAAELEAVLKHPEYRPGFHFLVDHHGRTPTTADARRMVAFIGEREAAFAGSRWAIVVHRDVDFGMARMVEALAEDQPTTIRVFRDREEGLRWLRSEPAAAG
jgi:hypothetical protein